MASWSKAKRLPGICPCRSVNSTKSAVASLPPGLPRSPSKARRWMRKPLSRPWKISPLSNCCQAHPAIAWRGPVTHVVDVTKAGYLWKGETHRSLSAIARAITGARWSGLRFFGLVGTPATSSGAGAERTRR
ncbi:DUF2924 domain-containing protein [bacterium]|nr:DUF2924 domain-containing protein [bacterium]